MKKLYHTMSLFRAGKSEKGKLYYRILLDGTHKLGFPDTLEETMWSLRDLEAFQKSLVEWERREGNPLL